MSAHNPPAFPCEDTHSDFQGMSLRDYFAAKAISVMDMDGVVANVVMGATEAAKVNASHRATAAYLIADAMLKARALPAPPATPETQS